MTKIAFALNVGDEFGSLKLIELTTTEGGTVGLPDPNAPLFQETCELPAAPPGDGNLRIVSWNVRNFPLDERPQNPDLGYFRRTNICDLEKVLGGLDADLLGLGHYPGGAARRHARRRADPPAGRPLPLCRRVL